MRAWLCESPSPQGACGHCGSCHAIDVRAHADLCVLMPEVQMMALGWPLPEKAQADIDDKKRKPSKEIRVEAMRDAVEFCQRTSARGRGKAVLVYPAEQMNAITANALLKTLEEPPGDARFVLASEASHQLLPTIRSRCLIHTMAWPDQQEALSWLDTQGVPLKRPPWRCAQQAGGPAMHWHWRKAVAAATWRRGHSCRVRWPRAMWRPWPPTRRPMPWRPCKRSATT